jgi:hypothetical protein
MQLNMTDQLTALEIVKRANNPEAYHIIELLRMTNQLYIDVPAFPANNGTINVTTQRIIRQAGQHRIYNQGVANVATQTNVVHDRLAILEAYSEVDKDEADHSGNVNALRGSEGQGIVKGMGITQAETLIYGDGSNPEEFDGLFTRRNALTLPNGNPDPNVIDAGGTGSNLTSIYVVAVGRDLFHLIYPQGASTVGVERNDKGEQTLIKADGTKYEIYREFFKAQYGITIRAPDAVKRICNIPTSMTGEEIVDILLETRRKLPPGASTYAMYANLDILIKIDKAAREKVNVVHTVADPWGDEITAVRDLRCRQMDVILNTETQVA